MHHASCTSRSFSLGTSPLSKAIASSRKNSSKTSAPSVKPGQTLVNHRTAFKFPFHMPRNDVAQLQGFTKRRLCFAHLALISGSHGNLRRTASRKNAGEHPCVYLHPWCRARRSTRVARSPQRSCLPVGQSSLGLVQRTAFAACQSQPPNRGPYLGKSSC